MFRYEKVEAHEQKLYKTTLSWKQKLDSKQTHSVDKETDPLRLITIREETETRDEAEMHNEMQENVEIQLNQKDNKINIIECQETKLTTNDVEEEEDVMVRVTKDRRRNTTKIGTTYVNGQKVLTTIDSCSSLTVIHHDITVTTGNSNIIKMKRETNSIDKDETENETENNVGQDYKIWLENLQQTDEGTINTDINNKMHPAGKMVESEQAD